MNTLYRFVTISAFASVVLVTAVTTVAQDSATTQKYVSSKGYTIQMPQGWRVADATMTGQALREGMRQFSNLQSIDFSNIDVLVFDDNPDDFAESINVVVSKGRLPVSESQLSEASGSIQDVYRSVGISPRNFSARIARFADRECFVFSYTVNMDGQEMSQTQYLVPGEDVSYIVTCTAISTDQGRYEPVFLRAMQSFKVTGSGLSFWEGLPQWLRWAIIGGGIGLAWPVIGGIFKGSSSSEVKEKTI
jgi:hypothetical protein